MSLSPEIQKALKEAFSLFDENQESQLNNDLFAKALQQKFNISNAAPILEKIKKADSDGSGSIDFNEFVNCLKPYLEKYVDPKVPVGLREMFNQFDEDGSGFIDVLEFKNKLAKIYGTNLSEEQVRDIFRKVDLNSDGQIDYGEFKQLMGCVSEAAKKDDNEAAAVDDSNEMVDEPVQEIELEQKQNVAAYIVLKLCSEVIPPFLYLAVTFLKISGFPFL